MKRAWVFAVLFVAACGKGPSEDQCKKLLDHLVELEFKKAGAAATSDELKQALAKQKTAVTEGKRSEFMTVCKDKMAKERVECALSATELEGEGNSVAKCDEQK